MRVNDSTIRAYLLGQVTEEQAARVETLLLEDEEWFAAALAAEDDLFDDFARGSLAADERAQFIARYGRERSKLLVADALANRASRSAAPKAAGIVGAASRRAYWIPLAAAAALVAAIGISYLRFDRPAAAPAASVNVPAPAIAPSVLALTLGTARSATSTPEVTVPPDAGLELRVRLDPADKYQQYSMELRSALGAAIWRTELRQELDPRDPTLVALIPSAAIATGTFELAVRGLSQPGSSEDLGFVTVSIKR